MITTHISRPFEFVEVLDAAVPTANEAEWGPYMPPSDPAPRRITQRSIYVFWRRGNKTELYAELAADAGGYLSVRGGDVARITERNQRPPFSRLGGHQYTLPHTVNGKRVHYAFYVSSLLLPIEAILAFETNPPPFLGHFIDVNDDASFVPVRLSKDLVRWTLPVIDMGSLATRLQNRYETACNNLLGYTTEFKEQNAEQTQRVRERHGTLLLAQLLRNVIDQDPENKLGLKNEFKNDDPQAVHRFIDDYEKTAKQLIDTRDRAGQELCHFISGPSMQFVDESYQLCEKEEYHKWLEFRAATLSRLSECPAGQAYIGGLIDAPDFTYSNYVLRTSAPSDAIFATGRKAHAAILSMWKDAAAAVLIKNSPASVDKIVKSLHLISKEDLFEVTRKTAEYTYRKKNGRPRTVTHTVTEIVPKIGAGDALKRWAEHGDATWGMERLSAVIEIANLCLALQGVKDADDEKLKLSIWNMVGASLDTINVFATLLKLLSEKRLKTVGALSAIIDIYCAYEEAKHAYSRGDQSAAAGQGVVAVGSGLGALGCLCVVSGLGAGTTVIGIPLAAFLEVLGGVLIGAGWVISTLTADSDIELLVNNCRFGKNFPSKSSDKLNCYPIPFSDWADPKNGASHQATALTALLAQFKVKATGYTGIRITFGLLLDESTFDMNFTSIYNLSIRHAPQLRADLKDYSVKQVGSPRSIEENPQDLSFAKFHDDAGRLILDVEATWPKAKRPSQAFQHQHCSVDLLLRLDKSSTVPFGQKPLSYIVHRLERGISGEASSSD
ncbi:hypothetical protein LVJ94_45550 [Pendulispora rubella]|uniref:Uncharacterized protein n=1 Tax=Pendulispora rubella TaxID=2741070 RepID=A0ABZ2L019_9BACT